MEQKNTNTKKYTCEYPTDKNIFTQIDKLKEILKHLEEYSEDQYRDFGFNDIQGFIEDTNDYIQSDNSENTKEDNQSKELFNNMLNLITLDLDFKEVA